MGQLGRRGLLFDVGLEDVVSLLPVVFLVGVLKTHLFQFGL